MDQGNKHQVFVSKDERGYPYVIDDINPTTGKGLYSGESLDQMRKRYPNIQLQDLDEVVEQQETALRTAPSMITEEQYVDALEALPPVNWVRLGNTESFTFSERHSGRITTIYARVGKTCWSFLDVYSIGHHAIMAKIEEVIQAQTQAVQATV